MRVAVLMTDTSEGVRPEDQKAWHRSLIRRIAEAKDREAFEELFLFFAPRIKGLMAKSGATADVAEELAQEALLTVWRKASFYAPDKGPVSTWIFTIARNLRIDRLRRQSSRPYDDIEELEIASDDADGEMETIRKQRAERVALALETLPPEQRRVIELSFVHDKAQTEIAEELSLALGTVKSRMRLAYRKLRDNLENAV